MTAALTVIIVLATFMWPIYSPPSAEMLLEREADRIVALKDQATRDIALVKTSELGLEVLVGRNWEPAIAEKRRRIQMAAASKKAAAAKLERDNAPRIKALLADIPDMPRDWVENRRIAYEELTKLAPGNAEFRKQHANAIQDALAYHAREANPAANIQIVRHGWRVGGFGVAYILDITLKNKDIRPWGNFVITCRNQAASGIELEPTTGILMDKLRASQTRRFRGIVLGRLPQQVATSGCEITSADPL